MSSKIYEFQPFVLKEHKSRSVERPKGRSGHRIVCDSKNLYSFGGFNPNIDEDDPIMRNDPTWQESQPLFKEIWKFNFVTQRWKRLPTHKDMPDEVASSAVVLKDRTMIIYGGTGVPFGDSCSNRLYACDLRNGDIRMLPARGSHPDPHYGQAMITFGPYLYTVGGTTGYDYTCDIHRYDLRTNEWEAVYICSGRYLPEPRGRYRHELAFDGNFIYVLGGGTTTDVFGFQTIPAFHLETNRWFVLNTQSDPESKAVPAARRCHGAVQYTDEDGNISVVISGGYTGRHKFRDVWRLELKNFQWTCLTRCALPSPLYFHSVALTPEGKMYTFGGIVKDCETTSRTDAVHSTWLVIPRLEEICWEALNYYIRDLASKSRNEVATLGVPLKYVNRLENCER